MRILIVRHGESEADLLDVHEGRADFPLTERGHRQAAAMARYVGERHALSAIWHSTLTRARQTAEHLARETGAPLIPDERLMEFNNGLLAGLGRAEAREKYPPVEGLPLHAAVYGQESALDFRFRAEHILSQLTAETGPEDTVAVVTHGGTINQLYRAFLRLPAGTGLFFATGDTGIHEWEISGGRRIVLRANSIAHTEGL